MEVAAAQEASKSAPSADSYIGSLISLTSKSEIRYEGVLFNINTEESSIGLQNGRRKDRKQVPPSDRIYEYILFRGSDIKDLQVKSSPSQTAPSVHNDPAVIQTNYSRPVAPLSTSAVLPSVGSGVVPELSSSHTARTGAPPSTQSVPPLYQPTACGPGLAHPSGGLPHLQQPPLLRPLGQPPGLPLPPSMQQPLQYPAMNPSIHSGSPYLPGVSASPSFSSALPRISPSPSSHPNLPGTGAPQSSGSNTALASVSTNLPEFPLWPPVGSGQSLTSSKFPSFAEASSLALAPSAGMSLSTPPFTSLPSAAAPVASLPPFPSSLTSPLDSIVGLTSEPNSTPRVDLAQQATSLSVSLTSGSSSSFPTETSGASLLPSGQPLQPGPAAVSSRQPLQIRQQFTDVNAASAEPQRKAPPENNDAILPLPTPFDYRQAEFTSHVHPGHRRRGGGRGSTFASSATHFTEDFDFTVMNEKFNKDEVWGHLGKSHLQTRDNNEHYPDDDQPESSEPKTKPVYVKDDFFDSLSCNAFDHAGRNERARFSEKMRTDTETFGEFSQHRLARGGGRRGYRGGGGGSGGSGGRGRGFFYGRGYGYVGRGHGSHNPPNWEAY
ncbi:unnamed protein product [Spirodela intermedia]|uniref:Uncharacterized protein n=1 Tax=Spirodela intermedia TaxID=51605 RepID=A0A7I8ITW5_SPIIN|nr:unnamed protein product [Spirodela intermedia]CAA6661237.1 unnamed protein product [Spirodela intermedia]